jgi:hypothetical protein
VRRMPLTATVVRANFRQGMLFVASMLFEMMNDE